MIDCQDYKWRLTLHTTTESQLLMDAPDMTALRAKLRIFDTAVPLASITILPNNTLSNWRYDILTKDGRIWKTEIELIPGSARFSFDIPQKWALNEFLPQRTLRDDTLIPLLEQGLVSLVVTWNGVITINYPPIAIDDNYTMAKNTSLITPVNGPGVLGNDFDPAGERTLTAMLLTSPTNGTFSFTPATGNFSYQPPNGFTGVQTFTYKAVDNLSTESNVATVTITVL